MSEHSDFLQQDLINEHHDEILKLQAEITRLKYANNGLVKALKVANEALKHADSRDGFYSWEYEIESCEKELTKAKGTQ